MQNNDYQLAINFYDDLIDSLSEFFPRFREDNVKLLSVLHAFSDKIPLINVLIKKDMLQAIVLKKSSTQAQPHIAKTISRMAIDHNITCMKSSSTYATEFPNISTSHPCIIADHGGYGLTVPDILSHPNIIGITEHTLNGHTRFVKNFRARKSIPYLTTARLDLKERSDREISYSIAEEIMKNSDAFGESLSSQNTNKKILLIGYGTMGFYIAQGLQKLNCSAEIIISDISDKKKVFAMQDGFHVTKNLNQILPEVNFIILATNVIKADKPIFSIKQLALLKKDVCIFSITSADDELRQDELISTGIIRKMSMDNNHGVYKGPSGKRLFLMADGKPTNAFMPDGGVKNAMMLVEGAGIAGAMLLAQNPKQCPKILPNQVSEIIAKSWLKYYGLKPSNNLPAEL